MGKQVFLNIIGKQGESIRLRVPGRDSSGAE